MKAGEVPVPGTSGGVIIICLYRSRVAGEQV